MNISTYTSDFGCLKDRINSFIKDHPTIVAEIKNYFYDELVEHILKNSFFVEFTILDSVRTPDGSGRILLSPNLRDYAQLKNDVVFVGVGETFEIWAADFWQNKQGELNAETNAKRFSLLDLRTH